MVFRFSRGFPRLINTICENSLLTAYARQVPVITPDIVKQVAREFRLDKSSISDIDRTLENGNHANGHHFELPDLEDEIPSNPEQARL